MASFSSAQETPQKTLNEATESRLRCCVLSISSPSCPRRVWLITTLQDFHYEAPWHESPAGQNLGCCLFTDDQRGLCQEVESLQSHRSIRNRCKAVVAASDPSRLLQPLLEEAERSTVRFADRPAPSFLKSLN